ncbi:hypothetical protein Btru_058393 [Bulinus truncatus]|nr:hypothetical protein Btru_058393 [Bulinus truncatus]
MSLLLVKTKNLSWQDHTLNIEVMMSPQGSSLLMNKHKALDAEFEKEKIIFERQREARIKHFVIEKRFIQRQRQKLVSRSLQLAEERSRSALIRSSETCLDLTEGRSVSAPTNAKRISQIDRDASSVSASGIIPLPFPRISLRGASLFAATLQKTNVYSDTESDDVVDTFYPVPKITQFDSNIDKGIFFTETAMKPITLSSSQARSGSQPIELKNKPIDPSILAVNETRLTNKPAKSPAVRLSDEADTKQEANIMVTIKGKAIEEKVKDFLKIQEDFNSRPPSVSNSAGLPRPNRSTPLVAQRYRKLSFDPKILERSFDKYCENKSYDDLLKTMRLAARMKSHVRQARNTSLVPTIAAFKTTKSFIQLLKRKKRKDKEDANEIYFPYVCISQKMFKTTVYTLFIQLLTGALKRNVFKVSVVLIVLIQTNNGAFIQNSDTYKPDSFDWRDYGVITPVRNQGQLGDVMAFVIAEGVESLLAIQTKTKARELSVQEVADCCDDPMTHQPLYKGFDCIVAIGGLCADYSYKNTSGKCRNDTCTPVGKVTATGYIPNGREDFMKKVIHLTPIVALIDAGQPSFEVYVGGVYSDPNCSSSQLDHAVQIVGYGTDAGTDYWIVKNSWGTV